MKVLIDLDEGLLALVDAEAAGRPRVKAVRELLVEALRLRADLRGDEFPEIEPWTPESTCGRACPTPGYAPCSRTPHEDGPCAHEMLAEGIEAINRRGTEIIYARVIGKTVARIMSRPVRTAHEALADAPDRNCYTLQNGDCVGSCLLHASRDEPWIKPLERKVDRSVSSISAQAQTVAEARMMDREPVEGGET